MLIRRLFTIALVLSASVGVAIGQDAGGGGGGGAGGAGGGGGGGTGQIGGGGFTGGTGGGGATGGGGSAISLDDAGLGAALSAAQEVDTGKILDLRNTTLGRVGITNNLGAGALGANGQGSGPVGAGVRYRNGNQTRFAATGSAAGARGTAGGAMGAGGRGFGGAGAQGMFGQGTMGSLGGTGQAAPRIPLALGFTPPPRTTPISTTVSARIQSNRALAELPSVEVLDDGASGVTLRGTVDSPAQKRRLELAAKVMGGVRAVKSEIVVREGRSPSDQ